MGRRAAKRRGRRLWVSVDSSATCRFNASSAGGARPGREPDAGGGWNAGRGRIIDRWRLMRPGGHPGSAPDNPERLIGWPGIIADSVWFVTN